MTKYVHLTFKKIGGGQRTVWARRIKQIARPKALMFVRITKEGDEPEPRELIIIAPADIKRMIPAKMNLHYGELEETMLPKRTHTTEEVNAALRYFGFKPIN